MVNVKKIKRFFLFRCCLIELFNDKLNQIIEET
jgi:hypothetical protein